MDVHDADAETRGSVAIRQPNSGRSVLLVALLAQSVLVALCIAVSFHNWYTVHSLEQDNNPGIPGIYLEYIGEGKVNEEKMKFRTFWTHRMELNESLISFPCSGPYLVYLSSCSIDLDNEVGNGNISLVSNKNVLVTFPIQSSKNCQLQSSKKDQKIYSFNKLNTVSLKFTSQKLRLGSLHLSFHYMLGHQCFD